MSTVVWIAADIVARLTARVISLKGEHQPTCGCPARLPPIEFTVTLGAEQGPKLPPKAASSNRER